MTGLPDTATKYDPVEIQARLDALNGMLGELTPFKFALVDPRTVKAAPKNARFMTQPQMAQLAQNIQQDGNLSTVPFAWKQPDGSFMWIGGHHRSDAAIEAGVQHVITLYTDDELSTAERISRQLGDNAIIGQDDPQILSELYAEIRDFEWKQYSGLDDEILKYNPDLDLLGSGSGLKLEPVTFMLFNDEIERFDKLVKDVKRAPTRQYYGSYDDVFDSFFDALLDYGLKRQVVSSSTALALLTELARAAICFESDDEFLLSIAAVAQIAE